LLTALLLAFHKVQHSPAVMAMSVTAYKPSVAAISQYHWIVNAVKLTFVLHNTMTVKVKAKERRVRIQHAIA